MKSSATPFLLGLTILTSPLSALAAESLTFSGSIAAERESDSSVSLDQIDDVSRESDYANQLKLKVGGKWQANENVQFATSYQGRQRTYDQFSEYDLEQHLLGLSSKFTYAGIGYSYRYDGAVVDVDGEDFLDFSQSTVAIDKLFDANFFLRAAISQNKKDFIQLDERSATGTTIEINSLVFFNSGQSHLSFNISMENETAEVGLFDNKTANVGMAYQHKFTAASWPATFTSSVRYARKRYDSFVIDSVAVEETEQEQEGLFPLNSDSDEATNEETRVDGRIEWSTRLDIELNDWLGLTTKASYIENDSNYASVDFNENLFSVGIIASF
jgi:hypothetical protein